MGIELGCFFNNSAKVKCLICVKINLIKLHKTGVRILQYVKINPSNSRQKEVSDFFFDKYDPTGSFSRPSFSPPGLHPTFYCCHSRYCCIALASPTRWSVQIAATGRWKALGYEKSLSEKIGKGFIYQNCPPKLLQVIILNR